MLKSYLKIALRSIYRNKAYTLINIVGLAVGMACCLLITLWIRYELTYDRFHDGAERIYRIVSVFEVQDEGLVDCNTVAKPLQAAMVENFQEVRAAARIGKDHALIRYEDRSFHEDRVFFVEPDFFDVFSFGVVSGDPRTRLAEPYTTFVTEETAKKLFGDQDPIGKTIHFGTVFDLTVAGVMQNVPENSHLKFDYLVSRETRRDYWHEDSGGGGAMMFGVGGDWGVLSGQVYLKLNEGVDAEAFEKKLAAFVERQYPAGQAIPISVQPLTDIHLHGQAEMELEQNSDVRYVYFVSAIALLILLIAGFNYMNLSTARSAARAREVGMRKVLGARRWQLVKQFLGESIILSVIAMILAVGLAETCLPAFNTLIGTRLELSAYASVEAVATALGIAIVVGIVSGCYPAIFLSSFKTISIFRVFSSQGSTGSRLLRSGLVVIQYVISIVLVICTLVVHKQLQFVHDRDLGIDTDYVLAAPINDFRLKGSSLAMQRDLLNHSGVLNLTTSTAYPTNSGGGAGGCWWEGKKDDEQFYLDYNDVDYDFMDFYGMELIAGRGFSSDRPEDKGKAYVLNEAAVRACGWDDAIGKQFGLSSKKPGLVIGVVKDFHFASMHEKVGPMALRLSTGLLRSISLKIDPNEVAGAIAHANDVWKKYSEFPLEYRFLDDVVASRYESEERLSRIFACGTVIAIFVAGLGLFGLASYTTERRTKEIGIRRVLGATVAGIVLMLSRQFARWVLIAELVACPVAYYAMDRWLNDFAYRTEIGVVEFLLAGGMALVVALVSVGWEAIRAARADPVKTLRYE